MRPLYVIACDIRRYWPRPYFAAVPYIEAMESLNEISDTYITESGASIVRHFLVNAGTWRGGTARNIKAELRAMVPD